jgi:hypothetical protein
MRTAMEATSPGEETGSATSRVDALVVGGDEHWLFVVMSPLYLEVERESVDDIEDLPLPAHVRPGTAVAVRITLREPTSVRHVRSSAAVEAQICFRRVSFPIACRPDVVEETPEPAASVERARSFLASFGIEYEE